MRRWWQSRIRVFLFAVAAECALQGQVASPSKSPDVDLGGAQTIAYCEILSHPEIFNNKKINHRPVSLAHLDVVQLQTDQFRPAKATTEQHGQHRIIALGAHSVSDGKSGGEGH